jgi:hypothetical protein
MPKSPDQKNLKDSKKRLDELLDQRLETERELDKLRREVEASSLGEADVEKLNRLHSLVAERRWPEIMTLLEAEKTGDLFLEFALLFEQIGDQNAAAGRWGDAVRCFHLGQWPAGRSQEITVPPDKYQRLSMTHFEIYTKFTQAFPQAIETEPGFWESVADEAIGHALDGRFDQADQVLGWFYLNEQGAPALAACAARFESAADMLGDGVNLKAAVWLLKKAQDAFEMQASLGPAQDEAEANAERVRAKRLLAVDALEAEEGLDEMTEAAEDPEEADEPEESEDDAECDEVEEPEEEEQRKAPEDLLKDAIDELSEYARVHIEGVIRVLGEYVDQLPQIAAEYETSGDQYRWRGQTAAALQMY